MLCSKVHFQTTFNLILFPYKIWTRHPVCQLKNRVWCQVAFMLSGPAYFDKHEPPAAVAEQVQPRVG